MYDLEEQEQIDALKGWWKENRRSVFTAVLVGGLVAAGIYGWRYYQHAEAEQAAMLYDTLEKAARSGETKKVKDLAVQLTQHYASTAYSPMGALVAARVSYEAGDARQAEEQLRFALEHARDDESTSAVRLRLAGLLLDSKRFDEGLKLLDLPHPEAFHALYSERRGDILAAQGKAAEARSAYKLALDKLTAGSDYRMVVQLKLDSLGGQ